MATRVEFIKEIEQAAQRGDLESVRKGLDAIAAIDEEERAAVMAASQGERDAWKGLLVESLKSIRVMNAPFTLTLKNIGQENYSLTVGVDSTTVTDAIKAAIEELVKQAPATVSSMAYTSKDKVVVLNQSNTKGTPRASNGTRAVGWHKGSETLSLGSIYNAHATHADKTKAAAIEADNVVRGKSSLAAQHNADMYTLKESVAKRNGYTH